MSKLPDKSNDCIGAWPFKGRIPKNSADYSIRIINHTLSPHFDCGDLLHCSTLHWRRDGFLSGNFYHIYLINNHNIVGRVFLPRNRADVIVVRFAKAPAMKIDMAQIKCASLVVARVQQVKTPLVRTTKTMRRKRRPLFGSREVTR